MFGAERIGATRPERRGAFANSTGLSPGQTRVGGIGQGSAGRAVTTGVIGIQLPVKGSGKTRGSGRSRRTSRSIRAAPGGRCRMRADGSSGSCPSIPPQSQRVHSAISVGLIRGKLGEVIRLEPFGAGESVRGWEPIPSRLPEGRESSPSSVTVREEEGRPDFSSPLQERRP